MPQTREHLRHPRTAGGPRGWWRSPRWTWWTPSWSNWRARTSRSSSESTRYAGAPMVHGERRHRRGVAELLPELDRLGAQAPPRPAYPATRMPVDRVFSSRGIGTVVTGTLWSGTLSAEDTVAVFRLAPGRFLDLDEVRVQGTVQVHDHDVHVANGGQRVALDLTGVARRRRGPRPVGGEPRHRPTYLVDARLTLLRGAPAPLPPGFPCRGGPGRPRPWSKLCWPIRRAWRPESPASPSSGSRSRCWSTPATSS